MIGCCGLGTARRKMEMPDYWLARYLETLSQIDSATNPKVRLTYVKLADHYRAMHRLCSRSAARDFMLAA